MIVLPSYQMSYMIDLLSYMIVLPSYQMSHMIDLLSYMIELLSYQMTHTTDLLSYQLCYKSDMIDLLRKWRSSEAGQRQLTVSGGASSSWPKRRHASGSLPRTMKGASIMRWKRFLGLCSR